MDFDNIYTYEVSSGHWVVSENSIWLPGIYESENVARRAASFSDQALTDLGYIYRFNGENRPISDEDLSHVEGVQ